MRILHVVGARPNFMKAAPVIRALAAARVDQTLIHTGQHYDSAMSQVFFDQLGMPQPDFNLGVGSGTHAEQTARIMIAIEPVLQKCEPNLVLVYGDVNSTVAAALVCSKLGIEVGHVEAGLRSGDRSMPEEINRLITDQLADLLFTPSVDGDQNLQREGIAPEKIHCVGNVMIDTLVRLLPAAEKRFPPDVPSPYILVTLHRPSNVDDLPWLQELVTTLSELSSHMHVIFPVHPRTRQRMQQLDSGAASNDRLRLLEPLPYLEFLALQQRASIVITDSGGIQEETTFLGVPCFTVRDNTERPITIEQGSNQLVGRDISKLRSVAEEVLRDSKEGVPQRSRRCPPLWDGHAAERIAQIIVRTSA